MHTIYIPRTCASTAFLSQRPSITVLVLGLQNLSTTNKMFLGQDQLVDA